jgi:hypothetical protein
VIPFALEAYMYTASNVPLIYICIYVYMHNVNKSIDGWTYSTFHLLRRVYMYICYEINYEVLIYIRTKSIVEVLTHVHTLTFTRFVEVLLHAISLGRRVLL